MKSKLCMLSNVHVSARTKFEDQMKTRTHMLQNTVSRTAPQYVKICVICTGAGVEGDGERAPDVRVGRKSSRHGKPSADHFRADHGYGVLLCCFACAHALADAPRMLARSLALMYTYRRVSIHLGVLETVVIVAVLVHALQNLRDLIPMRLAISPPMRCR